MGRISRFPGKGRQQSFLGAEFWDKRRRMAISVQGTNNDSDLVRTGSMIRTGVIHAFYLIIHELFLIIHGVTYDPRTEVVMGLRGE